MKKAGMIFIGALLVSTINLASAASLPIGDIGKYSDQLIMYSDDSKNITFVTTGSTFAPRIQVRGNPVVTWTFADNTTSSSLTPEKTFGSNMTRLTSLNVTPWSALTSINVGYDRMDGGLDTMDVLEQQNVIAINGLQNVNQSLETFAASYNPIMSLNFSGFTNLTDIEVYEATSLESLDIRNTPVLTRLCIENCHLAVIDLSGSPMIADIRAARQSDDCLREIIWGDTGAHVWHLCIHSNPYLETPIPYYQLTNLSELLIGRNSETGTLKLYSNMVYISANDVLYDTVDISGIFPIDSYGYVEMHNGSLTHLDITNDPGLLYLDANQCKLNTSEIDIILSTFDSYGTSKGKLNLTSNSAPSPSGIRHAFNLKNRGWDVVIDVPNNLLFVNKTVQVSTFVSNSTDLNSIYTESLANMLVSPSEGTVNVTVYQWNSTNKIWSESSETHNTVTQHILGDFPANSQIQLNVDGVKQAEFTSNAAGYITFAYAGGYSEHTFEAFVIPEATISHANSIGIVPMIVLVLISAFLINVLHGKNA